MLEYVIRTCVLIVNKSYRVSSFFSSFTIPVLTLSLHTLFSTYLKPQIISFGYFIIFIEYKVYSCFSFHVRLIKAKTSYPSFAFSSKSTIGHPHSYIWLTSYKNRPARQCDQHRFKSLYSLTQPDQIIFGSPLNRHAASSMHICRSVCYGLK